jgi:hypothetical protein
MKCRHDEENLGISGFRHIFLLVAQNLKNRQSLMSTCSNWQYEVLVVLCANVTGTVSRHVNHTGLLRLSLQFN